jgi:gamma-glutamylcyclotransferase (GGCT)/AIG2-like uncharacterized protein YtfP
VSLRFFVYGTLLPGEPNHGLFLAGRTRSEEPGRLSGAVLYDGPGYPYAVEERGGVVHGELVTVLPQDYGELLADLDRLEEYTPGDPRNLYERVEREVHRVECDVHRVEHDVHRDVHRDGDGPSVRAWVYVAAPAVAARLRARGRLIGSGDWRLR